jgi:copper/silver efflux system protein
MDVGGRTVELSEFEFIVRGRGYLKGIPDLQRIVLFGPLGPSAPARARNAAIF